MTQYPNGDKPLRIFTAYQCPLCNQQIRVRHNQGETLKDVWRLHRIRCRTRVERDGGEICKHLGPVTGESVSLGGCGGGNVALFGCPKHRVCLPYTSASKMARSKVKVAYCAGCEDYEAVAFKHSDLCGDEVTRRVAETMGRALDPREHNPSSTPSAEAHEAE